MRLFRRTMRNRFSLTSSQFGTIYPIHAAKPKGYLLEFQFLFLIAVGSAWSCCVLPAILDRTKRTSGRVAPQRDVDFYFRWFVVYETVSAGFFARGPGFGCQDRGYIWRRPQRMPVLSLSHPHPKIVSLAPAAALLSWGRGSPASERVQTIRIGWPRTHRRMILRIDWSVSQRVIVLTMNTSSQLWRRYLSVARSRA